MEWYRIYIDWGAYICLLPVFLILSLIFILADETILVAINKKSGKIIKTTKNGVAKKVDKYDLESVKSIVVYNKYVREERTEKSSVFGMPVKMAKTYYRLHLCIALVDKKDSEKELLQHGIIGIVVNSEGEGADLVQAILTKGDINFIPPLYRGFPFKADPPLKVANKIADFISVPLKRDQKVRWPDEEDKSI